MIQEQEGLQYRAEISKAVIEKDGKYLLLKRIGNSKSFSDMWDFAGGRADPGETPEETAIREVREETSFEIEPGEEVKTQVYQDGTWDLTFHYFIPKSISGELKLSSAHSEFRWFDEEEIKQLEMHPSVPMWFKK